MSRTNAQVCFQAASLLLGYPDEELRGRLDLIEQAVAEIPEGELFAPTIEHFRTLPLGEVQSFYVQEFDLSRRHAMHLSYWTDGDTRRRGEVLAMFKQVYRDSGLIVDLNGELPDHLPMVLEFTACGDYERGMELLNKFRAGLELLRLGLREDAVPHEHIITAICQYLTGPQADSRVEVQKLYGTPFIDTPPVEQVGLQTYQIQMGRPS